VRDSFYSDLPRSSRPHSYRCNSTTANSFCSPLLVWTYPNFRYYNKLITASINARAFRLVSISLFYRFYTTTACTQLTPTPTPPPLSSPSFSLTSSSPLPLPSPCRHRCYCPHPPSRYSRHQHATAACTWILPDPSLPHARALRAHAITSRLSTPLPPRYCPDPFTPSPPPVHASSSLPASPHHAPTWHSSLHTMHIIKINLSLAYRKMKI
jgi:hypothetical protein